MMQLHLATLSLKTFGNSLGIFKNFVYWLQHQYSKLFSTHDIYEEKVKSFAKKLKKNGYVILESQNVDFLAQKVSTYFSQNPCVNGTGFVDKKTAQQFSSDIFHIIKGQASDVLKEYYGSNFQNYWATIMRYEVGPKQDPSSAFGFHLDDNPKQLLKIFIYLNDTHERNGAFRAFDYSETQNLIRKGFISCSPELRVRSQKLIDQKTIEEKLKVLEGKKGTVLIFDNNLIHKGTLPIEGYRDTICVEIYPSHKEISTTTLEKGLGANFQVDFPANPFVNDILTNN